MVKTTANSEQNISRAESESSKTEKVFFDGEFGKICGVLHSVGNKEEIVILIHGFSSTKETSSKINAEILTNIGIDAIRIDLDNMGESDLDFKKEISVSNYIKQVEATINFVKKQSYKNISLLGSSFGGLVVLSTALSHPEIKRILVRAPVLDYPKHLRRRYSHKELEQFKEKGFIEYNSARYGPIKYSYNAFEDSKKYSMYEHASKIKMPICIIQGDVDEAVDYKVAIEITPFFPNAKLHMIKGANHNLAVNKDFSEGQRIIKEFFKK